MEGFGWFILARNFIFYLVSSSLFLEIIKLDYSGCPAHHLPAPLRSELQLLLREQPPQKLAE